MPTPLVMQASGMDWVSLLPMLMDANLSAGERAWIFHATLAASLISQAVKLRDEANIQHVGLTGGVFQNRLLTELIHRQLNELDFNVHLPHQVPMNDAGLSFGQVIEDLHTPHE